MDYEYEYRLWIGKAMKSHSRICSLEIFPVFFLNCVISGRKLRQRSRARAFSFFAFYRMLSLLGLWQLWPSPKWLSLLVQHSANGIGSVCGAGGQALQRESRLGQGPWVQCQFLVGYSERKMVKKQTKSYTIWGQRINKYTLNEVYRNMLREII